MTATKNAAAKSAKKKATKTKRSANVPGQLYGYSIQITRVVAHFLRAQQGQSVSIEHLDDVATHTDAGGDFTTTLRSALPADTGAWASQSRKLGSEMPSDLALAVTLRPWLNPDRA